MVSYKEICVKQFEAEYNLRLEESTFINDFQRALQCFPDMQNFQETWGKELISEFEKQMIMLNELQDQLINFNSNQTGLSETTSKIEKGFDKYDELSQKNQSELFALFTENCLAYSQEKNSFFRKLSKKKIPPLLATLGIDGNVKNVLDSYTHIIIEDLTSKGLASEKLINSLKIIKNPHFHACKLHLSNFIFVAHKEAFSLLQQRIKKNLLELNIQKIKEDCDDHVLYLNFYRDCLVNLVNSYQDYNHELDDLKNKLETLEMDVGDPIKDWLNKYRQFFDPSSFPLDITQKILTSKCKDLSQFKTQLKIDNPTEFLQEVKNKIQNFLDNEIEKLEQEFQACQTTLKEFAASSKIPHGVLDKLLKNKKSLYLKTKESWLARKKRLDRVKTLSDLKNFNQHFPAKNLFSADVLNREKTALHLAFIFLDASKPIEQNKILIKTLSKISVLNLDKNISFILENIDVNLLPRFLNHLLQFVSSENNNLTNNAVKEATSYFKVNCLKTFFTKQSEKTASYILHTLDNTPFNITLNAESYKNLIRYLLYIDLNSLEELLKCNLDLKLKIIDCYKDVRKIKNEDIHRVITRLILTKKLLNLFVEEKTASSAESTDASTICSLGEACCLFQQFSELQRQDNQAYPFLGQDSSSRNLLYVFQEAVFNVEVFLRDISTFEKRPYLSTLFLNSGQQKKININDLINNLKKIPITQADKNYINDFFENWKKTNAHIINAPRDRFFIGLIMLIYRHIKKIFFSSNFNTTSHQTVNELQKFFSNFCEILEELSSKLDCSKLSDNQPARSENCSLAKNVYRM